MLFAELVDAARDVAATRSRRSKIERLASVIRALEGEELEIAVAMLAGEPRQGKIGIGWSSLYSLAATPAEDPTLTISEVDAALSTLMATTGPRSAKARGSLLSDLLTRCTGIESDFIRRLLVGELRQGALEGLMVEALAHASGAAPEKVRRALMMSGSLPETARAAAAGPDGLDNIGLEVLRPLKPMLASTAQSLADAISGLGAASVEWKLDGIRIQVHRKDDEVRIFTRNLNDITDRLPEVADLALGMRARSFILDGEAMTMFEDMSPRTFQETMSRVGRHVADTSQSTAAFFFDCLTLDGQDLVDEPLSVRAAKLDQLVGELRIPSVNATDLLEAQTFMDAALDAGHEGVVVKDLASVYQAGRRGKSWRKVKPVRSLDLVVIGVEWGHGRRSNWLSNLHLGARDPAGGFVMVGKTFKGLTDQMLEWQTRQLQALEIERKGITVYVEPKLVVEIALDGVQRSTRYPGGVALRFARVRRYRQDKDPMEADTIDTVRGLLPR